MYCESMENGIEAATAVAECPVCLKPFGINDDIGLPSFLKGLFLPECCGRHMMHVSCARNTVKADRLHKRPPSRCPVCRIQYTHNDMERLLPLRRHLKLQYCIQPYDDTSDLQIVIKEKFDPSLIPEARNEARATAIHLTAEFKGQNIPTIQEPYFPPFGDQTVDLSPVTLPPPHHQQQQQQRNQQAPTPFRQVLRTNQKVREALEQLSSAISRLDGETRIGFHREQQQARQRRQMRTRSMTRQENNRYLDRMAARVAAARGSLYGLNLDLIDFMLASPTRQNRRNGM